VVERLRDEKLSGDVRTIVGGAPVTEAFAGEIGADAYGFDAANAVQVVKRLSGVS
jgi:5-methyltetrahydrofolate--homocysteine methyltransferase